MVDIYTAPILNVRETARYLAMPASTLNTWRRDEVIHSVAAEHHGWPRLPFAAVVEAFVLRTLRTEAHFPLNRIREAVDGVRNKFGDAYALVRPEIAWDATDIFVVLGGEYYRARDAQQAIKQSLSGLESAIQWDGRDPTQLRLTHFGNVILDPRFGWGGPVIEANKVPLEALMGLWRGGERITDIAVEFQMEPAEVERLIQRYDRARDQAA